jgi:heptosyltransferase-2
MNQVRFDCRHFRGDRPCGPHKAQGVVCRDCPCYAPYGERILIIKLDAPGDVLRTTCILPELKKSSPTCRVSWLTRLEAAPLLANNPYVDEVITVDSELPLRLAVEKFDRVLSLDNSPEGARMASCCQAATKLGFGCNPQGQVFPLNLEAEEWFMMGVFDPIKQANRKSYPRIVHEIVGLPWNGQRPVLILDPVDQAFAVQFAGRNHLIAQEPVVGLFTGAGRRWRGKSWSEAGFVGLIELLLKDGRKLLLLGGPEERDRNRRLLDLFPSQLVDGGCDNSPREFAALVGLCDSLVTADTLALHVATALSKKVVVLVGPTSAAEIELYGRGVIVTPNEACRCYYLSECRFSPSCMETLPAAKVHAAVRSL